MSQVNSVKDLRNKHAKCLVQNKGKTPLIDIKGSSYDRPRTTIFQKKIIKNTTEKKLLLIVFFSISYSSVHFK